MGPLQWIDPYLATLVMLAVILVAYRFVSGTFAFWRLAIGADGRASTSKAQALAWTVVVLFAYLALLAARLHQAPFESLDTLPPNVLIALGLSLGTSIAAAGITTSHVSDGREVKPPPGAGATGPGALVKTDNGEPDLSKVQLLAWTVVALSVYLVATISAVNETLATNDPAKFGKLSDIDASLMVLTGLGQGAYLGKKLVVATVARISSIDPPSGPAGPITIVTLNGAGFGSVQGGSRITVDDVPLQVVPTRWTDVQVTFALLAPPGAPIASGVRQVGLIVGGQKSANTVSFEVTA